MKKFILVIDKTLDPSNVKGVEYTRSDDYALLLSQAKESVKQYPTFIYGLVTEMQIPEAIAVDKTADTTKAIDSILN